MLKALGVMSMLAVLVHGSAWADAKLLQDKQCMGCHDVKKDGYLPVTAPIAKRALESVGIR